jgi:hypothetical protein
VGRDDHDAGIGMIGADPLGAVDPLETEARRHLDVGHDHIR